MVGGTALYYLLSLETSAVELVDEEMDTWWECLWLIFTVFFYLVGVISPSEGGQ